ncbi:hypothetical protein A8W25_01195 [Streptomyces sp. ERV7]|uniref:hypothetical protein n=1 Tax=Streptomyces sp. ERV7 TaxID=1322334 RepID=UPI0007F46879|nr:hypothetical protein [Streptomyces sp. ERV7]OAR26937.1 hypothetical protein A8W25_01195 [Streptomyces sp. ERV7]
MASAGTWGETQTYSDGLAIIVGKPLLFQPTSTAASHTPPNQGVKWRITVTNGTRETFTVALVTVYVKPGTDGEQAEEVFDSAGNLGTHLTGTVLPGASATAVYGFDVPQANLGKIDLEVTPDFTHNSSHWVGSAR